MAPSFFVMTTNESNHQDDSATDGDLEDRYIIALSPPGEQTAVRQNRLAVAKPSSQADKLVNLRPMIPLRIPVA